MKKYLVGLIVILAARLACAQNMSSCENLKQHLAHEPHVTGVYVGVCSVNGELANAWTHPRVQCYIVYANEWQAYTRVKAEFPVGSRFESNFVYVMYVESGSAQE